MKDRISKQPKSGLIFPNATKHVSYILQQSPPFAEIQQLVELTVYYLYYPQCVTCVTAYSRGGGGEVSKFIFK